MAVNKLDPKVIFASEAPAQDTPAVFTNKTVGWGEARKNGGRPTIRQMNALQQDTDIKILWLNENAVTPYDVTIDYPTNAVTIKDGEFKIFNGTTWGLFLNKSSVGLGDVDNTSDLSKPISTSTQTALDLKADKTYVDSQDNLKANKSETYTKSEVDSEFDYIFENGAALPYKVDVTYEENAVVVKDGIIQQRDGSSWIIPFMRGSQNLTELTDVAQARTKLDVYAKSEALSKDNNLSELVDKATARTNLDVYSKAESDGIVGTPNATESVAGKAKIATTTIAQAGTNDTDIITAKKLRDALNATGGAPMYACRAWVNFNATTGIPLVSASGNVTSITDNGIGDFTVNFTTAMPDANYAIAGVTGNNDVTANPAAASVRAQSGAITTTSCRVRTANHFVNSGATAYDMPYNSVIIFR